MTPIQSILPEVLSLGEPTLNGLAQRDLPNAGLGFILG